MSTGCEFCDKGLKPTKMKRQKVHYVNFRVHICTNEDILKPSA